MRGWFLGVVAVDGGGEWRGPPWDQEAHATIQAVRCSFSSDLFLSMMIHS
jgi:hypothetical protein